MTAKIYSLSFSHPSMAAKAMLQRKGIDFETVNMLPGLHPLILRAVGFPGQTAPGLKINGTKIQGSRKISRALDEIQPEPPLFPSDPEERKSVEEAERWGDEVLQDAPRIVFRWGLANHQDLRRWMGSEIVGMPAPGLMAVANIPVAKRFARVSNADEANVRATLAELPKMLDKIDRLVSEGTIGGSEPNAADFQILATVRLLLAMDDLRPLVEGRSYADAAMRLFPECPGPVPLFVPPEWLPKAAVAAR